jgi:hypothetical protein
MPLTGFLFVSYAEICVPSALFNAFLIMKHRLLFLPDIRLIQKPDTGYPVRAGYRISGRILGLTYIFVVKYQINL